LGGRNTWCLISEVKNFIRCSGGDGLTRGLLAAGACDMGQMVDLPGYTAKKKQRIILTAVAFFR
jgi:hypothetical protein